MKWYSNEFYLSRLKKEELREMLEFYLIEIYEHFNYSDYTDESVETELEYLIKEDNIFFDHSVYYVLRQRHTNKIVGSVKTSYWDRKAKLPIEDLFDIDLNKVALPKCNHFWHLGRFVISNKITGDRIGILKKILFNAFYPVHTLEDGVIIAECDKKVADTLKKMGINSFTLGKSIEYICSETIPIYITSEWLYSFMVASSNRYLTDNNLEDFNFFCNIVPVQNEETKSQLVSI